MTLRALGNLSFSVAPSFIPAGADQAGYRIVVVPVSVQNYSPASINLPMSVVRPVTGQLWPRRGI